MTVTNLRAVGHDGEVYWFASPNGGRDYLEVTGPAGQNDAAYLRASMNHRLTWTKRGVRNLGIIDLVEEIPAAAS